MIAQECPGGIGWLVVDDDPGGVLLLFVAAGIYLDARKPPGSTRAPANGGIVIWFWTGLFWSLAVGCFLGVWGPEREPGRRTASSAG